MSYTDLTLEQKKKVCNGCGPLGWKGKLIPELTFNESCNEHDFDYWVGGRESDRILADGKFLRNMKAETKRKLPLWKFWRILSRRTCLRLSNVYFEAVRKNGHEYFYYGEKRTLKDLEVNK